MRKEMLRMERVIHISNDMTLLDNCSFNIFEGEILGVIAVNAQGRNELIRLMCQNLPIHYGFVYFEEALVNSYQHSSQTLNPVSVIDDRNQLIDALSIADNVFVLNRNFNQHIINERRLNAQLKRFTERLGLQISPDEYAANLGFFEKCVIELIKAVATGTRLIVLLDIENFLDASELSELYAIMRYYVNEGISFMYFCEEYEEAFSICDRIAFMKNGRFTKFLSKTDFNPSTVMLYIPSFIRTLPCENESHLADGFAFIDVHFGKIHGMRFALEKGECAVIYDKTQTLQQDMYSLLRGKKRPQSGKITLNGHCFSPAKLCFEIGFICEDPVNRHLIYDMSYIENLCFELSRKKMGFKSLASIWESVTREYYPLIGEDIYTKDISQLELKSLYSLVYYRIHLSHPEVVVIVQPFSGADMALKHHIIDLILSLKARKINVLVLAFHVSDYSSFADRLFVVENGHIQTEYGPSEIQRFIQRETP